MIDNLTKSIFFQKLKEDKINQNRSNPFGVSFPVVIDESNVDWEFREIRSVIFNDLVTELPPIPRTGIY